MDDHHNVYDNGRSSVRKIDYERLGKGGGKFKMDFIKVIEEEQINEHASLPNIEIGYTVKVYVKVKEGTRERLQAFEGVIIAKKGHGIRETFTVRKVSYGVGVERTFPVHSPRIEKIEFIRKGKIARAKLYYLRNRIGKAAKLKTKI